jgi:two-component system response regulator AlgR
MSSLPRILIVDDEPPARSRMRMLLEDIRPDWPHELVGEAGDGRGALDLVQSETPDIVLLDVQMPGMTGIEAAQHLAQMETPPAVVFVTAFDDFAVQAFEVNAFDYLMKPVRAERLKGALEKAVKLRAAQKELVNRTAQLAAGTQTRRSNLAVYERGRLILVPIEEIVYLKAEMKYVTIRTRERDYLTEESLVSLEQEFADRFIRVHRNALVSRTAIAGFTRVAHNDPEDADAGGEGHWEVMLRDVDERLPVSRRQWSQVRALVRN